MISKIIWQTYKDNFEDLPNYILECVSSWKKFNPEYEYRYFNDEDINNFVLNEFGQEWYDLFSNITIGAMKSDVWRYLIIYKYGGIYADIDTVCKEPISTWLKEDYKFVVQSESEFDFAQFLFAAEKDHILLKHVIDIVKNNIKNIDYSHHDFVYVQTGPNTFTDGIRKGLKIGYDIRSDIQSHILNDLKISKDLGFYCYGNDDSDIFMKRYVENLVACVNWTKYGYVSWLDEQERIRKEKGYSDS